MKEDINLNNKEESNEKYIHIKQNKTETKINDILSQYKKGIESIFEDSKFDESEGNYFLLIFKCPNSFSLKYHDLNNETLNQS